MSIKRPSMQIGSVVVETNKSFKQFIAPIKSTSLDKRPRLQDFMIVPIKSRSIEDVEQLLETERKEIGQKVFLSDDTLDKILGIKIPDPSNPNRTITKRVSIGKLLETLDGSIMGIQNLLNLNAADRQAQQAELVLFSQNIINELGGLQNTNTDLRDIIARAMAETDTSEDTASFGIAESETLIDMTNINDTRLEMGIYLMSNIPSGLSSSTPVFAVDGTPIPPGRVMERIRDGQVLDLKQRRLFLSKEDAMGSRTDSPNRFITPIFDPSGSRVHALPLISVISPVSPRHSINSQLVSDALFNQNEQNSVRSFFGNVPVSVPMPSHSSSSSSDFFRQMADFDRNEEMGSDNTLALSERRRSLRNIPDQGRPSEASIPSENLRILGELARRQEASVVQREPFLEITEDVRSGRNVGNVDDSRGRRRGPQSGQENTFFDRDSFI